MADKSNEQQNIALILDVEFGTRLNAIAPRMPVWILTSPVNDATASALRAAGVKTITTLLRVSSESSADTLWRAVRNIEEHHGNFAPNPYESIVLYGVDRKLVPADLLREFNFEKVTVGGDCLILKKS